ncbi:MAG: DUF2281 domain-containing protein [Magnetococcales bacterium]|nr:DUF2281 domain-containing protein [Magnetococcales bacterium]
MIISELIKKVESLPEVKQAEVFDFVEFLLERLEPEERQLSPGEDWNDVDFSELSMVQALRGMEDDPVVYTLDDLRERWT